MAFDVRWSRIVRIHSPMRDVAVMADPVEQLPAAGVVVPAPIAMNSLLDVRHHLRGSDPGVVVEFGWWSSARQRFLEFRIVRAFWQAHFHALDFADQPVADDFS